MIPLVDLKSQYNSIKGEISEAIQDVLDNTAFVMGKNVSDFEKEFAEFCGMKHGIRPNKHNKETQCQQS
ncbi:unnamed protein product [marine sediment metagenome]|uniref:Uncharacterized protein n=1 Tax=marine sediment metagenome TaxID=412755 RepID=X1NDM0_9ZZZZ